MSTTTGLMSVGLKTVTVLKGYCCVFVGGRGMDKDHVSKVGNDQKKFGNHWNRMCTGKKVGLSQRVTSGLVKIDHAFVR